MIAIMAIPPRGKYRPPVSLFGSQEDQKPDNHLDWPNGDYSERDGCF